MAADGTVLAGCGGGLQQNWRRPATRRLRRARAACLLRPVPTKRHLTSPPCTGCGGGPARHGGGELRGSGGGPAQPGRGAGRAARHARRAARRRHRQLPLPAVRAAAALALPELALHTCALQASPWATRAPSVTLNPEILKPRGGKRCAGLVPSSRLCPNPLSDYSAHGLGAGCWRRRGWRWRWTRRS